MTNKPTFVFDFDGTICTKVDDYLKTEPRLDVIGKLNKFADMGCRIVIFTARGMRTYGNQARAEEAWRNIIEEFLRINKVRYDELIFGKPPGDYYVDDKGMNVEDFVDGNSIQIF